MFGHEAVKVYQSQGVPMYFAVSSSHKQKYAVKIVTTLPEEKVCWLGGGVGDNYQLPGPAPRPPHLVLCAVVHVQL